MRLFLVPLGIVILVAALADLLLTAFSVRGGGPITTWATRWAWSRLLALHAKRPMHIALSRAGFAMLLAMQMFWIAGMCLGWIVLFAADPGSVVRDSDGGHADLLEQAYFVSYSFVTLGLGDYRPHGTVWQVATSLVAGSGLLAITLIISYSVPLLTATAAKRQLAATIGCLGTTPQEIVLRAWDGRGFAGLDQHLAAVTGLVAGFAQQFPVFPLLHQMHGRRPDLSLALRVASLDEALLLLEGAVSTEARPPPGVMRPARAAMGLLIEMMLASSADRIGEPPPPPDPEPLREAGLPLLDAGMLVEAVQATAERRSRLAAIIEGDGWSWHQVTHPEGP